MIGTKFYKDNFNREKYAKCAKWCNKNDATIEDKGEYYEVVALALPTLEEIKTAKIAELKVQRDKAEVEPIEYKGYLYDYDEKARDRINAAIIALSLQGEGATIDWTTADNQDVKVTANDLRMVIAAVAVRSNTLHMAYRKAREQVEATSTAEEVEAVTMK